MTKRRLWTREETILAVDLYCRTPFGRIHNRNKEIIALSEEIGRSPNSVALKMANFASLDPTLDRAGMSNHSRLDKEIWDEFFAAPDQFIEKATSMVNDLAYTQVDSFVPEGLRDGGEYTVLAKSRKNQGYFRQMVLAAYNAKCAITGIDSPELLIASHILPWSSYTLNRTDPRNGICLNALHDKAFDRGLLSLDDNYRVLLSKQIKNKTEFFDRYEGQAISLPSRFLPSSEFVRHHREQIFVP